MTNSYIAKYRSIDKRTLLGGVLQSESCRYGDREEAELRLEIVLELNGEHCRGEVVESVLLPEIFRHCGKHSQAIDAICPGCRKKLTVEDAREFVVNKRRQLVPAGEPA